MLRRIPGTLGLIIVNILVFSVCVLSQKSDGTEDWTLHLLQFGAQFNPLTLDKQWYRIFTHMFLHASILHLAFNMYALFSVGALLEPNVGTKKFLMIYFVCGIAAALTSLYWSLFLIGVGASGAIFGLFGFSLVMNLFLSRRSNQPTTPLIVNFFVFIVLNLMIAKAVRADNAAHFGGLVAGAVIGSYSVVVGRLSAFRRVHIEHLCLLLLVIVWFSLPRFQVSYFKFFNYVVALEDATEQGLQAGRFDAEYLRMSVENVYKWDTAMQMLNDQHYVPEELAADTFRLRRYIRLHKEENLFRKKMIERQSYTYLDSLAWVHEQMAQYTGLDYHLAFNRKPRKIEPDSTSSLIPMKVWFDEDWIEVPSPPASYYRIGYRDSLGKWNGPVQDFYENGAIQMKGTYRDDKRDGVFLFYSDHNTYTSAGRFVDDKSVGKWETFHYNGELESEIYYNEYYFLRNLWDSVGNQMVTEGNGKETRRFSNDIVSLEGIYKNGLREGYWYGRHANG